MMRCPRCLHGELTDSEKSNHIIACDYCGYRNYKYSNNTNFVSWIIHKIKNFLLNPMYRFGIYYKKQKICFALFLANIMYVIPMIALFFIIFIFIVVSILGLLIPNLIDDPRNIFTIIVNYLIGLKNVQYDILVTFFIMLGVVDLTILVLHRYVYKHIDNLISDLNKLAPDYFSDSRQIIIDEEMNKPNESKLYPERLLIFGIVIILLDFASKLLNHKVELDLKIILIGISMVLISIGIWKYLSFQADEFVEKSESKDKSDRNSK